MDVDDQTAEALGPDFKRRIDRIARDYLIARRASDPDRAKLVLDQIAALHYEYALAAEEHTRRR
jgi:hypothetical protein